MVISVVITINTYPAGVCRFIYETEQFNGVGELLEILGRSVPISTAIII